MKFITNRKELAHACYEISRCGNPFWHPSQLYKGYYYWNASGSEKSIGYPILYALESDLIKVKGGDLIKR